MTQKLDEDLNSRIITDALIILASVGFIEKEINHNFSLLEEAVNNGYNEDVIMLEDRIKSLLNKIGEENHNMSDFMIKYKKEVEHEKKTVLSNIK